ncbi:unnamed protein product [Ilex paraguariensis]|uniref:Uncharacterized protein n=1 Tax=Ilex paraguariensis TaxID=185542 RepID=A0ABC8SJC7_9AQUA
MEGDMLPLEPNNSYIMKLQKDPKVILNSWPDKPIMTRGYKRVKGKNFKGNLNLIGDQVAGTKLCIEVKTIETANFKCQRERPLHEQDKTLETPLISVPVAWVANSISVSSAHSFCASALYELPFDKTAKAPSLFARDCQGAQPVLPAWIVVAATPLTWPARLSTACAPAHLACTLAEPEASPYTCASPSLA